MQTEEQIRSAIAAHGMWKSRLRTAIESGKANVTVEQARSDDQCAFGKWLYGDAAGTATKSSPDYTRCRELHQRFHGEAAKVLQLALAGKKQEAISAMGAGSAFAAVSSSLTMSMTEWASRCGR